ncbi:MAG: VWA domain-containing protein [Spartobacteria bacterium]|nr:VWA domain-containing protein [Spartobacteria bacterium]
MQIDLQRGGEDGFSLIAMALTISVCGLFIVAGIQLYQMWDANHRETVTEQGIRDIQAGLSRYLAQNGRYPCPAPLDAAIDTPSFGNEVSADCTAGAFPGTFRAAGRDGRMVRTGAVPVRTLGLDDRLMFDGHKKRFIYAVTEEYASSAAQPAADRGAIAIIDADGNNGTAVPGNIAQIVYSMGLDNNGAYNTNGLLLRACDPAAASGENCDFTANATFRNTIAKSMNENTMFVHKMAYAPARTVITCADTGIPVPGEVAFLVDTSGSMDWKGQGEDGFSVQCPATMPNCKRIHVAQWAMRRAVPARIMTNALAAEPGATGMTGFVARNNVNNVQQNLGDITIDDPTQAGYEPPTEEELSNTLEGKLQGMCPTGNTPLGIHIEALADKIGDGTPERPNKVVVISDGVSNNGTDPAAVARSIARKYPNIQVDIIDIVGNPSLRTVAETTGGQYFPTSNPDELLEALFAAVGVCGATLTPVAPADPRYCGE